MLDEIVAGLGSAAQGAADQAAEQALGDAYSRLGWKAGLLSILGIVALALILRFAGT
jgi:hypothetical protein